MELFEIHRTREAAAELFTRFKNLLFNFVELSGNIMRNMYFMLLQDSVAKPLKCSNFSFKKFWNNTIILEKHCCNINKTYVARNVRFGLMQKSFSRGMLREYQNILLDYLNVNIRCFVWAGNLYFTNINLLLYCMKYMRSVDEN